MYIVDEILGIGTIYRQVVRIGITGRGNKVRLQQGDGLMPMTGGTGCIRKMENFDGMNRLTAAGIFRRIACLVRWTGNKTRCLFGGLERQTLNE